MTKRRKRMYEKWYGQPYTPKTLVEVKVCKKCGRKLLKNSQAHNHCPYCGGPLRTKYISKQEAVGPASKGTE